MAEKSCEFAAKLGVLRGCFSLGKQQHGPSCQEMMNGLLKPRGKIQNSQKKLYKNVNIVFDGSHLPEGVKETRTIISPSKKIMFP